MNFCSPYCVSRRRHAHGSRRPGIHDRNHHAAKRFFARLNRLRAHQPELGTAKLFVNVKARATTAAGWPLDVTPGWRAAAGISARRRSRDDLCTPVDVADTARCDVSRRRTEILPFDPVLVDITRVSSEDQGAHVARLAGDQPVRPRRGGLRQYGRGVYLLAPWAVALTGLVRLCQ